MAEEVLYPLDKEKIYTSSDPLTLETDGGPMTLKMGAWLNEDPVRIHKMIVREKTLQVDTFEVLNPLVSKLRKSDPDYYKKFMEPSPILRHRPRRVRRRRGREQRSSRP